MTGGPPLTIAAHAAAALARRLGRGTDALDPRVAEALAAPPPAQVPTVRTVDELGRCFEQATTPTARRRSGTYFTPPELARRLVAEAAGSVRGPVERVHDPACGGGAFLLAALRHDAALRVSGCDRNADAVAVARTALALATGRPAAAFTTAVTTADGLQREDGGFDLVVGNPPFLGQLRRATADGSARRSLLRARFGDAVQPYTDPAALFLLAAVQATRPGGATVLVLPESVVANRDAAVVRELVLARGAPRVVWRDHGRVFPRARACALLITVGEGGGSWSGLFSGDVPNAELAVNGTLRDHANATASFRDAYYELASRVLEGDTADPRPRLHTSGLIDPARSRWGSAVARFAKRRWLHPVVPEAPTHAGRVLVATQTRVLEAWVDDVGVACPVTPVVTLTSDRPWHVAAALTGSPLTALALRRHDGAALSPGALRLRAADLEALPAPADSAAWDAAAEAFRTVQRGGGDVTQVAAATARAYRTDPALAWFAGRLPTR